MQYYFQNGGSILQRDMLYLHDYIQFYLIIMIILIIYMLYYIISRFFNINSLLTEYTDNKLIDLNHNTWLEIIWTIIPCIILVLIAIPGFNILYKMDQAFNSQITLKCLGSQWFWTYEISDYTLGSSLRINFDSYMIDTSSLILGDLRLSEVDNAIILPINKLIRILVSSTDVIHSFSIPSLGIKIDAVPGRLNQVSMIISRTGHYYGACQEICGIQHAFMPIKVIACLYNEYLLYLLTDNN